MRHKLDITCDTAVSLLLLKDDCLDRRVLKILEMVEAGATFAIRHLAAESRLSPAYLQRLFKSETGIRMGQWLSEQRLQRAAYLLSNSHLPIKEISHAIGYEHTSSFVRAFERRFRQAPARYRKQHEGKYEAEDAKRVRAA